MSNDTKCYYAVIGAGGSGQDVMPLLLTQIAAEIAAGTAEINFAVEEEFFTESSVNGIPVVTLRDFLALPGFRFFAVSIANSIQRSRIVNLCEESGAKPISVISSNTINWCIHPIGVGLLMCPFATIAANAVIGCHVHLNFYSYVAHDCELGDFVTFAPFVKCNGHVRIERHAYLGTGAIIRPGNKNKPLVIGEHAFVAMGAIVTKDVPPNSIVAGHPARISTKSRWKISREEREGI